MHVPFLDLKVTDKELKKELHARLDNILNHGRILDGKEIIDFEDTFSKTINTKYAVGVSSGSSALYLALLASGVGPGDEVITTPFTWVITVNAITETGAKPVFIDINNEYNIDPCLIANAITKKTKAIVPMHVAGQMCDMELIAKSANRYNLKIIEDAAQAFCSSLKGKRAGNFSSAAAFSMNPMKILHAYGEAGVVTTNNRSIYEKIKSLRHAGTKRDNKGIHINKCEFSSLNHKMDVLQASFLVASMNRINQVKSKRDIIASYYDNELKQYVDIQTQKKDQIHGRYIYLINCNKRDKLRKFLKEKKIETKIFYSPLVCDAPIYKEFKADVPNARKLMKNCLSIPLHEKLSFSQAEYVVDQIKGFYT